MTVIAEAEANLAELLDRATSGEVVTIERANRSRVQLRRVPELRSDMTEEEWMDWWEAHSYDPGPTAEDSVSLLRRLRGYDD